MNPYIAAARALVMSPEFAETLTDMIAIQLEKQFQATHGGGELYIHKKCSNEMTAKRNEAIRRSFTGNNLKPLAEAYGITERQVRRIVNSKK